MYSRNPELRAAAEAMGELFNLQHLLERSTSNPHGSKCFSKFVIPIPLNLGNRGWRENRPVPPPPEKTYGVTPGGMIPEPDASGSESGYPAWHQGIPCTTHVNGPKGSETTVVLLDADPLPEPGPPKVTDYRRCRLYIVPGWEE